MKIEIVQNGMWYHGSNRRFLKLRKNSTITQWKELAEAFSHKPSMLEYDDSGILRHNGNKKGYLYVIDEPAEIGKDIQQHPRTILDENAEFLTNRRLKVKLVAKIK